MRRCGWRLESCWSNGKPAYRCRHGYSSAVIPGPARPGNAYVREEQILPHLAAIAILLAGQGSHGVAAVTGGRDAPAVTIGTGTAVTRSGQDRERRTAQGTADRRAPAVATGKDR
jgi:hypothetical protein